MAAARILRSNNNYDQYCSEKMKGGGLVSITVVFALLALADGGLLFGKKAGLVKGAFKTLFKQEKQEEQHCEIKWEDVWKPHCTTTYEKVGTISEPVASDQFSYSPKM